MARFARETLKTVATLLIPRPRRARPLVIWDSYVTAALDAGRQRPRAGREHSRPRYRGRSRKSGCSTTNTSQGRRAQRIDPFDFQVTLARPRPGSYAREPPIWQVNGCRRAPLHLSDLQRQRAAAGICRQRPQAGGFDAPAAGRAGRHQPQADAVRSPVNGYVTNLLMRWATMRTRATTNSR